MKNAPLLFRLDSTAFGLCVLIASLAWPGFSAPAQAGSTAAEEKIAQSVTIYRDKFGVPHIHGPTDASCVFGYAYAQAEDNFWQVEDSYIRALGRASEIYGEGTLNDDLLNRALEIPRLAREEYERSSPRARELSQALVDGLNYFLARNPQAKPRLITRFEPWHPLAFTRFALYQLFIFQKSGLRKNEIRTAVREIEARGVRAPAKLSTLTLPISDEPRPESLMGSNMWAIAPQKSATGHAMLFINPHQPFFGPGQWYEGHLHSDEGWNLSGASFFGSPYPLIGHNEHLGWSHTVNDPDIVDLFIENFDGSENPLSYRYGNTHRNAIEWVEGVKVKTGSELETKTFRFQKTHRGPIVSIRDGKPLSIRLARLEEGGWSDEWYEMGKARNLAEFKAAMKRVGIPMFNTMYADREGNIYYVYNGSVPRRSTRFDWTRPVDGSNPETEWQGYHSLDELPQMTNPQTGFLQNCNQTPFWTTTAGNPARESFPLYMTNERDNARARISRRILDREERFTFDEWKRAAFDTKVIEAELRIPEIVIEWEKLKAADAGRAAKLNEAMGELKTWDAVSTIESKAMTLFTLWFERMDRFRAERVKDDWLKIRALEETVANLERDFGTWRIAWGEINRLQRVQSGGELEPFSDAKPSLPISGAPGGVGIVNNFYARSEKGQKRRYGVAGTSFVSVVEFGPKVLALSLLVFGQSADTGSPHYFDQAELYSRREFKPAWFTLDEVKANSGPGYHPGALDVRAAAKKSMD